MFHFLRPPSECVHFSILPALVCLIGSSATAGTPNFMGLGQITSGVSSFARGVSDDGRYVGGSIASSLTKGVRWDVPNGTFSLMSTVPFQVNEAWGISADGSTLAGSVDQLPNQAAGRWTSSGGLQILGHLPGGSNSRAFAASHNGLAIVGESNLQGFLWRQGMGMMALSSPAYNYSSARDISYDGSVVVGGIWNNVHPGDGEAYRWDLANGMIGLGDLAGGAPLSTANAVSPDGTVIVGKSDSFLSAPSLVVGAGEAFRWTIGDGMEGLGALPGFITSEAMDVTASGNVVVGTCGNEGLAFIWDTLNGMRNLKDVLQTDYGLDLTGWTLRAASAITPNGSHIVGWGEHVGVGTEAWIVELPEPATLGLLIPILFLARQRRH